MTLSEPTVKVYDHNLKQEESLKKDNFAETNAIKFEILGGHSSARIGKYYIAIC